MAETPNQTEELVEQEQPTEFIENEPATEETEESAETAFAVFGGEELKVEPRRKDAHRGKILGIQYFESEKNHSKAIQALLQSDDTGANDIKYTIFVPSVWAENVGAFVNKEMGLEDLPPGEPDPERPGKIKGNQRMQYGIAIKNSAGDAAVQTLLSIAAKSGRRPTPGVKLDSLDAYINELNAICAGLDVVFTRVPQTTDENPRGFLQVNRLYFPDDVVGNPKVLKNYLKHWETETAGQ